VNVWVIIVNWNGAADTEACLQSLFDAQPRPYAIAIVDNGSSANDVERLQQWAAGHSVLVRRYGDDPTTWPTDPAPRPGEIVLLASRINRGFAGGNNVALAYAARDPAATHFLLLNNDATIGPSYFADLSATLGGYETVLASGTIYEMAHPDRVWYAGGTIVPLRTIAVHHHSVPASPAPVPTEFICGCTMLIAAATLRTLGPLPECYFPAYLEDTEYSKRAGDAGIPVLYVPRASAYHKVGASLGPAKTSPRVMYALNRNRGFWARRNLRGPQRLAALLYLVLTKPVRAVMDVLEGHPRVAWAGLTGLVVGLVSPRARA
jgi:GT2 family glycosyltransferase